MSPLVQIGPVLDGVLEGLVRPHGVGRPGVQDEVAEERLVEGGWLLNIYIINYYLIIYLVEGGGAHAVDAHAAVDHVDDGVRVTATDDGHLVVVVLQHCECEMCLNIVKLQMKQA